MANNLVEYILTVDSDGAVSGLKKVEKQAEKAEDKLDKTGKKGKQAGDDLKKSFSAAAAKVALTQSASAPTRDSQMQAEAATPKPYTQEKKK